MSKTEYAWVIQRDDGMFGKYQPIDDFYIFVPIINFATFHLSENDATQSIKSYHLKALNCRPVKVKISIVGEDDEKEKANRNDKKQKRTID